MRRNYNNTADPIALTVAAAAGASVFTVASTAGYPPVPFILGVERGTDDEEVCLCTAMTATTFTVERGYDGTTAVAHAIGASLEHCVSAIEYDEANAHINSGTHDDHVQYMRADGTRHDTVGRHAVGTVVPVGLLSDITVTAPGASAVAGASGRAADAAHGHGMPTYATIRDAVIPAGVLWEYTGLVAPAGWVLCDGSVYSSATYPALSAACGTRFNTGGEGAGNFRVPDLRGRSPMGYGSGPGLTNRATIGQTLGAETHVLSVAELASHGHGITDPGHVHGPLPNAANGWWAFRSDSATYGTVANPVERLTFTSGSASAATGVSIQPTGGNNGHNTIHPVLVLNYIVKAA